MAILGRGPDDDDDDGGSPFEGRAFILSAIVVSAIVVCGAAILLLGRGSDTPTATATNTPTESVTTAPSPEPTGPPATPDPSDTVTPTASRPTRPANGPLPCKRPATEEGLIEAPAAVSWDFEDGMLVPYRDSLGAGIIDGDGLKRCFHRSPAGAVVATLTTLAQAQDPRHLLAVVNRRVMPGQGQRLALAEARRVIATPSLDTARNEIGQGQYVGYKVIDYTREKAILNIALQVDSEHIGGIPVIAVWSDGDWKIQLRPDGQLGPAPDVLASLDGYIRFRGA